MAAIAVACGFSLFGLWQLIKRGSLKRVDRDIYALAGLYIALGIVYVLFEKAVVNYRPIDMGAGLEPSFPSSHTMLTCCIMSSAIWQFKRRIKSEALRKTTVMLCTAVMAVTIAGRLVSGVHWITDIAGGILISASLMAFYRAAAIR
jgi:membrane-associated phospholipid phosphatase